MRTEELTKCYEPLQKLRVRLRPCKASNLVLLIVPSRYFCGGSFCFMSWCLKYLCAVGDKSSMVDILSQRLPLQRDFAHNAH